MRRNRKWEIKQSTDEKYFICWMQLYIMYFFKKDIESDLNKSKMVELETEFSPKQIGVSIWENPSGRRWININSNEVTAKKEIIDEIEGYLNEPIHNVKTTVTYYNRTNGRKKVVKNY